MTYGAYENVCYKTIIFSSRLLHENPHLKSLFAFMNVNGAPFDSPMFKSHVRNVFTVIGDAVSHIDDLDSLSPILKDLGVKHQGYGAKREYLEVNRKTDLVFFFALKYTNKSTLCVLINTLFDSKTSPTSIEFQMWFVLITLQVLKYRNKIRIL